MTSTIYKEKRSYLNKIYLNKHLKKKKNKNNNDNNNNNNKNNNCCYPNNK
jgi:hypothetical protein